MFITVSDVPQKIYKVGKSVKDTFTSNSDWIALGALAVIVLIILL